MTFFRIVISLYLFDLSMISGQTLRVCPGGKPVSTHRVVARGHAFPDHARDRFRAKRIPVRGKKRLGSGAIGTEASEIRYCKKISPPDRRLPIERGTFIAFTICDTSARSRALP